MAVDGLASLLRLDSRSWRSLWKQQNAGPPPPPVTVATPVVKEITEWDEYAGRFEAVDFVEVRARVSGYLESIHFYDG